jgi:uncharacterized coiled-coil DUF342 family protein
MNFEQLQQAQKEVNDKFTLLNEQKTTKQNELQEIKVELLRLQGEYRVYQKQIDALKSSPITTNARIEGDDKKEPKK